MTLWEGPLEIVQHIHTPITLFTLKALPWSPKYRSLHEVFFFFKMFHKVKVGKDNVIKHFTFVALYTAPPFSFRETFPSREDNHFSPF